MFNYKKCYFVLILGVYFILPILGDTNPNFTQIANLCGYDVEEYDVTTEDGYILKLFRIEGGTKGLPVLLVHGLLATAECFIVRGKESLSITLANQGYDVWIMNVRGGRYSLRHQYLDYKQKEFWNFTFHEMAQYDLPAIIDFILVKTGTPKLNAVGHSQGNLIFYLLGSTIPEYNEKVNVMIALAPIAYCQHLKGAAAVLAPIADVIVSIAKSFGIYHVFVDNEFLRTSASTLCSKDGIGYDVCLLKVAFLISGSDASEISPEFFKLLIRYFPSSSSLDNILHFSQFYNRKRVAKFDLGPFGNLEAYNEIEPPEYDLTKVTMKVVLLQGLNDYLSTLGDTNMLRAVLPNIENYTEIEKKEWNHIDFVFGKNMKHYLYPHIFYHLENNSGDKI